MSPEVAAFFYAMVGAGFFGYGYHVQQAKDAAWAKANILSLLALCLLFWPFLICMEIGEQLAKRMAKARE